MSLQKKCTLSGVGLSSEMFRIIDKNYYFKNKEYVYPSKQYTCYKFIEDVKKYCDKIILFGSAVTMHCKPDSDMDFAIEPKNEESMPYINRIASEIKNGCDIIWLNKSNLSDSLYRNINNGVIVYG